MSFFMAGVKMYGFVGGEHHWGKRWESVCHERKNHRSNVNVTPVVEGTGKIDTSSIKLWRLKFKDAEIARLEVKDYL